MEQHSAGKPHVNHDDCVGCKMCTKICAHDAITVTDRKATIDHDKCVGCGRCIGVCPHDAVNPASDESNDILNRKIAEYTKAVVDGRPCFYINMVIDVSPYCDCHAENDAAIVPDVGFFASFDPVALDVACADAVNKQPAIANSVLGDHQHNHGDHFHKVSPDTNWMSFDPVALDVACADAVNKQPAIANSVLGDHQHNHGDHFHKVSPDTNWMSAIDHAEKLGLGTREYELITVK